MIVNILIKLFATMLSAKHRRLMLALATVGVIAAIVEASAMYLVIPLLGYLSDPIGFNISDHLPSQLASFSRFFENEALGMFVLIILSYFLKTMFMCFVSLLKSTISTRIRQDISLLIYQASINQSYLRFIKSSTATLINNATAGISHLANGILISTINIAIEAAIITGIATILVLNTSVFALIVPAVIGTFGCFLFLIMRSWAVKIGQLRQEADVGRLQVLSDSYSSFLEVKLYGSESFFNRLFSQQEHLFRKASIGILLMSEIPKHILELLGVLAIFGFFTIALFMPTLKTDLITMSGLYAVAIIRLMPSFNKIVVSFNNIKTAIPAFREIEHVIERATKFENKKEEAHLRRNKKDISPIDSLELSSVSFCYPGAKTPIFQNINLQLSKGRISGIMGRSGAGKTTLLNIIAGVIPAGDGIFKINGLPVTNFQTRMQSRVGYVPQINELFNRTILENVAFDQIIENIDREKALDALRKAGAMSFIDTLSKGVNTTLSDKAMNLSGGQKQRICLARALYRQPDLLIFDEATSALDLKTEARFMKTVVELAKTKLILIVSHSASVQEYCDRRISLN